MKRILALIMALCLLALCGCSSAPENSTGSTDATGTTAAPNIPSSTQGTTIPSATDSTASIPTDPEATGTTAPAPTVSIPYATQPPVSGSSDSKPYANPLTGEGLAEPYTGRIFAVSINNVPEALPHRGVYQADIYMEMFVNHTVIRGLALYSNIEAVESIGAVRSTRPAFAAIAGHFDAFLAHAGGSSQVLAELAALGTDNMNIDTGNQTSYSYRDFNRNSAWEHTLFAKGAGLKEIAASKGYAVTQEPNRSYGMLFTEDGTPANGEKATTVTIGFRFNSSYKETKMVYNSEIGRYIYNQYGSIMADADTNTYEAFENVLVILANDQLDSAKYHHYDLLSGGDGYFACGGKLIPIKWSCAGADQPLTYTLLDGTPLELGVGSTYIALAPVGSTVNYS